LVKRIKKRIPKKEEPVEAGLEGETDAEGALDAGDPDDEAPPVDASAELTTLTEDKFTQRTAGVFQWLVDHRKLLLAGAAVVAVGAGVYLFSQRHSRSASEEAAGAFQAGATPYVDAHRASPESKAADAKKAQIEKAAQEFENTRSTYGDRRVAALATLGLAGAKFDLGQSDEAIKLYDDFLGRPDTDAFARSLALQGKAAAQEQKGDLAAAIETWKAVEGLDRAQFGLLSGVQVGRLLEAQGKGAEARTHYERLQKDFSAGLDEMANRPLKVEIERRVAALAAQG
jgi:tetratricopeptide (TPR) repeat protein